MKISLEDLNVSKKCEDGFRFEFLDEDGKGTGIFFTVIGTHAPVVQKWVNKELNNRRRAEAMQAKRGKVEDVRPIESDIEFGEEYIAMRIVAWEGITEECNLENALRLCRTNPMVVEQVRAASETLTNFTRKA